MPIYAYRCGSCGFEKDHLQKLSDSPLCTCPDCGQATYSKQVTAAGFQLKGTGWYATDFKGSGKPAKTAPGAPTATTGAEPAGSTTTAPASTTVAAADTGAAKQ
ncbi:FmdB family zinc ribbon protein [Accumulibacter sp.]|uniref:FmdB family zinc ribbon protein n=1 Tax=Accumulibacter sp. TaxID=2053492 RepID=UPI0028C3EC83|nr:FmdB family zinc ribbon protein [Accumulibacter sp.]